MKLLELCFMWAMPKPFHEFQDEPLHPFLVIKTIPRSLVVKTFGIVWVLSGLWGSRV